MWVEDIQGNRPAMSHQTNRIFRRDSIRYEGRKHNKPVFPGDTVTQLIGFKVYHYGYDTDQIAGKQERDLELLHKMREEEPDNAQVLFYLSQVYGYYVNDYPRALDYIWQYLRAARGAPDFQPAAYTSGAEIARHAQDMDAAARLIAEGLKSYPDDIDLNYLAARNAAMAGRADDIEKHAQAYLIAFDRLSNSPHAHDSRFLFFFDADSLCVILQLATVNHLWRGYSALAKFREYLPKTSEASREELVTCMTTDLDRIGERFGLLLGV
jgi:tetratricopeptide (TPR) repeat protein